MFRLGEEMKTFVDLLESEELHELLRRNKLSTYIDPGNIFLILSAADFKVRSSKGESIFSFIAARQDYEKNCCKLQSEVSANRI